MPEIAIHLFGTPRLEIDSELMPLGRRKAMALLAYLAVTRSRHHRETLATLLWPESGSDAAFSALRNVLWILRQTALAPLLHSDRSTIELSEHADLWVDIQRFRDLATAGARAALAEAVELVEAPFMDGFFVSNAEGFDDWQFAEREALRREQAEALEELTRLQEEGEEWNAVAATTRRWLHVDPLSEVACRRLMTALCSLGRRNEALRSYAEFEEVLDRELGLRPDAVTASLAERIRKTELRPSAPRARSNLPSSLTPFVGRAQLVERIVEMLMGEDARWITLVGLGGIGKTSLAVEVGRSMQDRCADGVYLVTMGAADGVEDAALSMAETLGLRLSRDREAHLELELADYLRERELLLILDEVERIPAIGRLVAAVLSAAPGVCALVTSRAPLDAMGETTIPLHGLDVPAEDVPSEELVAFDSIRLLKLAERRVTSPSPDDEPDLADTARVARLLEGFPLGLEMAGAWRSVFSWREIGDRISSNLDFLVHTYRDVPARHRNLRAVYEQAWERLSRSERAALRRLSVFRGAFTIEAAERTADASPAVLAVLAKRCLIRRIGPQRYRLHALLRQFSLENLRDATQDDEQAARARHAAHFISRIAEEFGVLKGADQLAALDRLRDDLPDVRGAWIFAAETRDAALLSRAAHGLFFYFDIRAHFDEGARLFRDAIDCFELGVDAAVGGFLRVAYGWFTQFTAEAEPRPWIEDGLLALDQTSPFGAHHALANVISCYAGVVDRVAARDRLEQSLAFYRAGADTWAEALTTDCLAGVVFEVDRGEGERLAQEALRLRRAIGDYWGEALTLETLADFAEVREEWDVAKVRHHQSQRLSERIAEDLHMAVAAQLARTRIAGHQGELDEARALAERALELARRAGSRYLIAQSLLELGELARVAGDPASAQVQLEEALSRVDGTPWRELAARCAEALADLAEDRGDPGAARTWRAEARTLIDGREESR